MEDKHTTELRQRSPNRPKNQSTEAVNSPSAQTNGLATISGVKTRATRWPRPIRVTPSPEPGSESAHTAIHIPEKSKLVAALEAYDKEAQAGSYDKLASTIHHAVTQQKSAWMSLALITSSGAICYLLALLLKYNNYTLTPEDDNANYTALVDKAASPSERNNDSRLETIFYLVSLIACTSYFVIKHINDAQRTTSLDELKGDEKNAQDKIEFAVRWTHKQEGLTPLSNEDIQPMIRMVFSYIRAQRVEQESDTSTPHTNSEIDSAMKATLLNSHPSLHSPKRSRIRVHAAESPRRSLFTPSRRDEGYGPSPDGTSDSSRTPSGSDVSESETDLETGTNHNI